ncbi:zinc-binding dehydrogenase [Microbacterium lacus]|uniref:zinc-binding dehydrogenase n=1 Tax=Microbacterium lacus TaxID=415217 RepID=UPI0038515056
MLAAVAVSQHPDDPLAGLALRDVPVPEVEEGWTRVRMRAASLNPHDLWSLKGVGHPPERIPMILGCDGAGVTDDGREVILYSVVADTDRGRGDETFDPDRAVLSETLDGTLAEFIVVPSRNLLPKPEWLTFIEAATLGAVWGTAYRMLFTRAGIRPGDSVLVQGANGGVASAAIRLASAAGARVFATARSEPKRRYALEQGAYMSLESGARLPERVDVVIETVGEATWAHSLRAVRPGGTIVIAGATSGEMPKAELRRIFYKQLSVIGSTMCTRAEFESLIRMLHITGIRPSIDSVIRFDQVPAGYKRILNGDVRGKIVVDFEKVD